MPNPSSYKRSRPLFFHGWLIVLVAFFGTFISAGIGGYGLGVFLKPMTTSLGWSRTTLAWFSPVRSVVMGITGPLLGPFVEHQNGPRLLFIIGGITAGIGCFAVWGVKEAWHFYIAFGVVWGFGQSLLGGQILSGPIVSKWFVKYRGRATSIYAMGVSGGGVVFIPLNTFLIDKYGWEYSWLILGFITLLSIIPLSFLYMRRQPEDMNLLPDGESKVFAKEISSALSADPILLFEYDSENNPISAADIEVSWTVKEASKTSSLWLLILSFNLMTMSIGATLLNQVPYLTDKNLGIGIATLAATSFGFVAMASKIPWGILADRFDIRYVTALCFLSAGLGLFLLVIADSIVVIFLYVLFYGIGAGGPPVLQNVMWSNYYGRKFQGAIRGTFAPLNIIGMGFAPVFATWIYDSTGNYDIAFFVFAIGCLLGGVCIIFAKPPVHNSLKNSIS